jgi:hypothetical protein
MSESTSSPLVCFYRFSRSDADPVLLAPIHSGRDHPLQSIRACMGDVVAIARTILIGVSGGHPGTTVIKDAAGEDRR